MKRGRQPSCLLIDLIDGRLLTELLFPLLNSVDAAQLGATCHYFKELVNNVRRFRLHYMRVDHPRDINYSGLYLCYGGFQAYEGKETLEEYGYVGEGKLLCYDTESERYVLFNDFYGRGFSSDHWDTFVKRLKADKEFDFHWKFIEFPSLPGTERHQTFKPYLTVHRGSCVWVSWKK